MAINVSVQYNGVILPDVILWTPCDYIGEPFHTMKSFCPYSQCSHLYFFNKFPPRGGCSEGLDTFKFFFKILC